MATLSLKRLYGVFNYPGQVLISGSCEVGSELLGSMADKTSLIFWTTLSQEGRCPLELVVQHYLRSRQQLMICS